MRAHARLLRLPRLLICCLFVVPLAGQGQPFRGVPPVPAVFGFDSDSADSHTLESPLVGTTVLDGGTHVVERMDATGTATAPVLVKCINGAELREPARGQIIVSGSYIILDGCTLTEASYYLQGDHIAVRGGHIRFSPRTGIVARGNNIVISGVDIEGSGTGGERGERHGITIVQGSADIWLLRNTLHGNSGDGVQFCHKCSQAPPTNVYIAGNVAFENRENGIDLKFAHGVVISGNEIYDHAAAPKQAEWCYKDRCGRYDSGSDGAGVVIGSDGDPTRVALFDNVIRNNYRGVRIEGTLDPILAGNTIAANENAGIVLEKRGGKMGIVNNVIANSDYGILQNRGEAFCLDIRGNTFDDNRRDVHLDSTLVRRCSQIETNAEPAAEDAYEERFESWFGRAY